jgi:hypothetical protein
MPELQPREELLRKEERVAGPTRRDVMAVLDHERGRVVVARAALRERGPWTAEYALVP